MKSNWLSFTTWMVGILVAFDSVLAGLNHDKTWVVIASSVVSAFLIIGRQLIKAYSVASVAGSQAVAALGPQQPKT